MKPPLQDQPTYGTDGACAYLRVSETALHALVESGELAASKPGREYVFRRSVLDEYLAKLEREQTEQRKEAFARGVKAHVQTAVGAVRKRRNKPTLPPFPSSSK